MVDIIQFYLTTTLYTYNVGVMFDKVTLSVQVYMFTLASKWSLSNRVDVHPNRSLNSIYILLQKIHITVVFSKL